jgi:hypothetical protein
MSVSVRSASSSRGALLLFCIGLVVVAGRAAAQASCDALSENPPVSSGRVVFVSPTGNNAASCNGGDFATLAGALQCFPSGTGGRVLFRSGTYGPQFVWLPVSGAPGDWIDIRPDSGATVIIDGGGSAVDPAVQFDPSVAYVSFGGFSEIRNAASCVKVHRGDHVVVHDNHIHDCQGYALLFGYTGHDVMALRNHIENAVLGNAADATGAQVNGGWAASLSTSADGHSCVTFRGNRVHHSYGECIDAQAVDTGFIDGNVVYDCYSVNVYLDGSTHMTVDRNYVYTSTDAFNRHIFGRAHGILLGHEANAFPRNDGTAITNNLVDSTGFAIKVDQAAPYGSLTIAGNTLVRYRTAGVWVDSPDRAGGNLVANDIASSTFSGTTFNFVDPSVWTDSTNFRSDPGFVGLPGLGDPPPSTGGYKLASTSPARDAGTDLSFRGGPFTHDFYGVTRDATPSIGADDASGTPPPPPPSGLPALATLTDAFTGIDTTKWTAETDSPGSSVSASGGVLTLSPEPGNGAGGAKLITASQYALTGSSITVRVPQVVSASGNATSMLWLGPSATAWNDAVGFWFESGTLYAFYNRAGVTSTAATLAYSSTAHAWWRIRESGGMVFWDTSADGTTWTQQGALATSALAFSTGAVNVFLTAKEFGTGNPSPGSSQFTQLNR